MIKKVPVENLRVGVFLEKIDQSWFATPFLFTKFKVTTEKQIQKLKDYGIQEVYIDTEKGLDVPDSVEAAEAKKEKCDVQYTELPIRKLVADTIIPFNLYIKKDNDYVPYLRQGLPFHSRVQFELESNKIHSVYVDSRYMPLFEKYEKDTRVERELSRKGLAPGFETQEKVERYNNYLNNYMPVDRNVFFPGMETPVSLYKENDTEVSLVLEKGKRIPENEIFSKGAKANSKINLLIHVLENDAYRNFLKELSAGKISGDAEEVAKIRAVVVKENSKLVTKDLLDNPRSGEAVKEAKNAVGDIIQAVLTNPSSFYGLMKINTYDYYTYVHSVNVCTLSIGLAMAMNLDKTQLSDLAVGSLMHDIGKSLVPSHLINKPGKLTDVEFVQVKNHVNFGLEVLKSNTDIPKNAIIPLVQHHEKLNGMGYPNKLVGEQVHMYGRISSIVDVYDALTTERSYKKAFKPFEAVSLLGKNKDEFDADIFRIFVQMLGKQALG